MKIKAGLTADELGEQLCDYCPLETGLRGVYSTPGGGSAGCEGSHCSEAYANYEEENTNENS